MNPRSRLIGAYDSGVRGPLLLVTAGVHGNEPAGVHALERVFATIAKRQPRMRGRVVGLIGNLGALERGVRYLDTDLNRMWSPARIAALKSADPASHQHESNETKEQRELITAIEAELVRPPEFLCPPQAVLLPPRTVVHLDLHSTSGDGPPFTILNQDAGSQKLAAALGVPAIFGIMKDVAGSMLDYSGANGFSCVVLEGGQNQAPMTVDHHESAVWLMLDAAGMLDSSDRLDLAHHRARIDRSIANLPPAVEICFRYAIDPGEQFVMLPGFRSFESVRPGQLLALGGANGKQEIRCPIGAVLLMPKYQGQGNDGFFLARSVQLVA